MIKYCFNILNSSCQFFQKVILYWPLFYCICWSMVSWISFKIICLFIHPWATLKHFFGVRGGQTCFWDLKTLKNVYVNNRPNLDEKSHIRQIGIFFLIVPLSLDFPTKYFIFGSSILLWAGSKGNDRFLATINHLCLLCS